MVRKSEYEKVVYDAKKTYVASHRLGIDIQNISFDIMLASYIIDPSRTISDVQSVVSLYGQSFCERRCEYIWKR